MKITPLDIQHKTFDVQFRGYHRRQVDRFLEELAEAVATLTRENATLHESIAAREEELAHVKKAEATLANTLVSTQNFADQLKRGAQHDADLIVKGAELKAEEMLAQARTDLAELHRNLSDIRKQRLLFLERLRSTLEAFERALQIEEGSLDQPALMEQAENPTEHTRLPQGLTENSS